MARACALWGHAWEEDPELVPSGSGIHHLLTSTGFLLDLTDVKAACCQRLQGGNPIQPPRFRRNATAPRTPSDPSGRTISPEPLKPLMGLPSALISSELNGELLAGRDRFHFSLQPSIHWNLLFQ